MVRLAATSPLALAFAATAALSAGCFDTSSTITTLDYPTLLTVEPLHFRGRLTCGAPGLARYVVTLFDVSEEVSCPPEAPCPTPVSTSIPVPCQQRVSFGEPPLQNGRYYRAIIEGYHRDDLRQTTPGNRNLYEPFSEDIVPPTWTTTCGEVPPIPPDRDAAPDANGEADATTDGPRYNPLRFPTRAFSKAEVVLHGCTPFTEATKPDASTDDASVPPGDAEPPLDVSLDVSDGAAPDGEGPTPEDAAEGGVEGGGEDGSAEDGPSDDGGRPRGRMAR